MGTDVLFASSKGLRLLAAPFSGQPLNLRTSDGTNSLYVLDGIGNPTASIADTGKIAWRVSYDAYGVETVSTGKTSTQWQQNPYGWKTGFRSSSSDAGLTKFGYRWQSATTGQWIERDTLDAPLSPGNANRYAFVACDPINGSDPTGRATEEACKALNTTLDGAIAVGALTAVGGAIAGETGVGLFVAGVGLGIAAEAALIKFGSDFIC